MQERRFVAAAAKQIPAGRFRDTQISVLPGGMHAGVEIKTLFRIASRRVPLAEMRRLVAVAAKPLSAVGHAGRELLPVADDPMFHGHASRKPACACGGADRIGGIGTFKIHAHRRDAVRMRGLHRGVPAIPKGIGMPLVGADHQKIRRPLADDGGSLAVHPAGQGSCGPGGDGGLQKLPSAQSVLHAISSMRSSTKARLGPKHT